MLTGPKLGAHRSVRNDIYPTKSAIGASLAAALARALSTRPPLALPTFEIGPSPLLTRLRGPLASILNTFGAVPFFFCVLHLYVVHALAMIANASLGRDVSGFFDFFVNGLLAPERLAHLGFALPWVYAALFAVIVLLYPLCHWWRGVTSRRRDWWLSYL